MPAGLYPRTEITTARQRLTFTNSRVKRLQAELEEALKLQNHLETRINELQEAESK